jgi:hypothetical protein
MQVHTTRDSGMAAGDHPAMPAATPFRSFTAEAFKVTPSWQRLASILSGNGGCFGLYGPRGAGKSWLMLKAIEEAKSRKGLGLWFPCPSEYDASSFLSTLADNLANVIEQRFVRNSLWMLLVRRLQVLLAIVISAPVVLAVIVYVTRGLAGRNPSSATVFSPVPRWLWLLVGIAIGLLAVLFLAQIVWEVQATGQLVRSATALRERIRFTTSLKLGSEVQVRGGKAVPGTFRRSRERGLDERPTTVASLVYEFRRMAELIVKKLHGPVVIAIDELDKIDRPESVVRLLRDVKGIFEIENVTFLVSVSQEAASALQLGPLRASGRNEFDSSFYTVLELQPLSPAATLDLLRSRNMDITGTLAGVICLLGAGNVREIVRLAERAQVLGEPRSSWPDPDLRLVVSTLEEEAAGLVREIINGSTEQSGPGASAALAGAWQAFPRCAFATPEAFSEFSKAAIGKFWKPDWADDSWERVVQESWRRLLIRLFVAGAVVSNLSGPGGEAALDEPIVCDLRDVMIMASYSSAVARLMLEARFNKDLSSPYHRAP